MENTKYASQNMPIPGSAQLFTQNKNAITAFVCSWNLRVSCQPQHLLAHAVNRLSTAH